MSSIRPLAIALLVILTSLMVASFAQSSKSGKDASTQDSVVEVKTDKFSGNVTVTMKPQVLIDTPEQKLTMELTYRLNQAELARASFITEEAAGISLDLAVKQAIDYGDFQLHFLVDGKPISIGETSFARVRPSLAEKDEKGRRPAISFSSGIMLSELEKLAAGKKVDMRLGSIELPLSQSTLAAIREFAREFANHAPTRTKKKGAKP